MTQIFGVLACCEKTCVMVLGGVFEVEMGWTVQDLRGSCLSVVSTRVAGAFVH